MIFVIYNDFVFLDASRNYSRLPCSNGCGRSYKYKSHLNRHLRDECGIEPRYKCDICFKAYSQKGSLKLHYNSIHKIMIQSTNQIKQCDFFYI